MQSGGMQSPLTLCLVGAGPAESRAAGRDRRGALWFSGPSVEKEIVQKDQRGNGSAFLTGQAPTLSTPHPHPPLHPSLSPIPCSQQLFFSFFFPFFFNFSPFPPFLSTSRGGEKKYFLMGLSQIVFTDIFEAFHCKENICAYLSLTGSLMAAFLSVCEWTKSVSLSS